MPEITVYVKLTAGGERIELKVDPSILVSDLKAEIANHCPIAKEDQRVIYRGQILKDERTVESYGGLWKQPGASGWGWVSSPSTAASAPRLMLHADARGRGTSQASAMSTSCT